MYKLISHTDYADSAPLHREERFRTPYLARQALARILRDVRHDLDVVLCKDAPEAYFLTNTVGPMRWERSVYIDPPTVSQEAAA